MSNSTTLENNVIALVGFTCAGKDTLADFCKDVLGYSFASLHVTRKPRPGESEGNPHYFTNVATIERMKAENELISLQGYLTKFKGKEEMAYYALNKKSLSPGIKYVLPIGFNTIPELRSTLKDRLVVIFIDTPEEVRHERAKLRPGYDPSEWKNRADSDREKYPMALIIKQVDYILTNDNLDTAKANCASYLNNISKEHN